MLRWLAATALPPLYLMPLKQELLAPALAPGAQPRSLHILLSSALLSVPSLVLGEQGGLQLSPTTIPRDTHPSQSVLSVMAHLRRRHRTFGALPVPALIHSEVLDGICSLW